MTVNLDIKRDFLTNFQKRIITARKLLFATNHKWASKLFNNLLMEIERTEWLDIQKKHQLTMIISNSWWMYLNSLARKEDGKPKIDLIRYIDAYKRFFSFLSKLDDHYFFKNFGINLLKQFIKMKDLSQIGITKFINSFSAKLQEKGEMQKLIELQILLIYLRKSVSPSEYFNSSIQILGKIIFKIEPSKRALFIYMILENVCLVYQLMDDSPEFVRNINKILINRLPSYLKIEFSTINRIAINERSFNTILIDLEDLIYYLNDIGEYSWIPIIIKNIYMKVQEYQSYGDAVTYIRKFIDFSIKRNRFEITFEIYDFLEDLFIYKTDLSYDNILIELWVEACKKFVDMKEKKYLLQSLEKLDNHLKLPQTNSEIFHYFYTCNLLWQFKSMFFSLEHRDFWKMMFYRALFEEENYTIAERILPYLDKDIGKLITDIHSLYKEIKPLKNQIYSFEEDDEIALFNQAEFLISQIILRINFKGNISYRMISVDEKVIQGNIENEYWNDTQIMDIYNELFLKSEEKKYDFNLNEFGELLFLCLPKLIRSLFKSFKIESLQKIPQIYFILDNMTVPFDLIFDNNFFLLKYSMGYKIGETPLCGITFEQESSLDSTEETLNNVFNILIIDSVNSKSPLKWNEEIKNKELLYPFPTGINEINYIVNLFNNRKEVNQIKTLFGSNSTRESIISALSSIQYHIIIFIGNIFYSKWNPKDSYFLTNDNEVITLSEINNFITLDESKIQPFLFFNTQMFNNEGQKLNNTLRTFGEIVAQFDHDKITGIISRTYPLFNEETNNIISHFFINLFSHNSQGYSLLKSRQQCVSEKMEKFLEQNSQDPKEGVQRINLRSSLAVSSFLLYGQPWKGITK